MRMGRPDRVNGQVVKDFELPEVNRGRLHRLSDHRDRVVVIVFIGTSCPIGELYMGRLAALARTYHDRGVDFLAVNSNASETIADVAAHARESGRTSRS